MFLLLCTEWAEERKNWINTNNIEHKEKLWLTEVYPITLTYGFEHLVGRGVLFILVLVWFGFVLLMNYVYLGGNIQYRIGNAYIYDNHLKVGEDLNCACTLGLQSSFHIERIKTVVSNRKIFLNYIGINFVVCKTVRKKDS